MNNKKIIIPIALAVLFTFTSVASPVLAARQIKTESSVDREVKRTRPIDRLKKPTPTPLSTSEDSSLKSAPAVESLLAPSAALMIESTSPTLGPNLIANPSLETSGSSGLPSSWLKGGYGSNTRVLTYPSSGNSGNGVKINVSNYTDGDAKWYFADVPVSPGQVYEFSDFSSSTVETRITVRYTLNDKSFYYADLGSIPASSSFVKNSIQFAVPTNVVSLTIFHALKRSGALTTDDYSLNNVTYTPTPRDPLNLLPNQGLDEVSPNGLPTDWLKTRWGTNTTLFSYPVSGVNGNAAKLTITNYASGDAKWRAIPVSVEPGKIYTYSDKYMSDKQTILTLQFTSGDGRLSYKDIAKAPASPDAWATITKDFTVPTGVTAVSVMHLLNSAGFLSLDDPSLVLNELVPSPTPTATPSSTPTPNAEIFSTGAVTLRFDDGWVSDHDTVMPMLDKAGLKGTFYIISRALLDYDFSGYLSKAFIKELYNHGHEIGAHSQNHPHLTQLSASEKRAEIEGSRQDLLDLNVGPISSFAYPYGEYDLATIGLVQDAGFESAVSTIDGYVTLKSDKLQLERQGITRDTTPDQIKTWIDNAIKNKQWLILSFHEIDHESDLYGTTPEILQAVVDYLVLKNVPVVTISQGATAIK